MRSLMRMPQQQARGRVGQAAVMRSVLEPCNPTRIRPDPSGRVQNSRIRVGSGYNYLLSGRVGLNFRLSCSPLIGMAFDLRTRKSERSQRLPRESCVRNRDNTKPIINLNRAIEQCGRIE